VRRHIAANPRPINTTKIYNREGDEESVARFFRILFAGGASARFHRPHPLKGTDTQEKTSEYRLSLSPRTRAAIRSARMLTDAMDDPQRAVDTEQAPKTKPRKPTRLNHGEGRRRRRRDERRVLRFCRGIGWQHAWDRFKVQQGKSAGAPERQRPTREGQGRSRQMALQRKADQLAFRHDWEGLHFHSAFHRRRGKNISRGLAVYCGRYTIRSC
jgi:hypothetical protein